MLRLAAALENASEHPLASAIVAGAAARGIENLPRVEDFRSLTGRGVTGRVEGRDVTIGGVARGLSPFSTPSNDDNAGEPTVEGDCPLPRTNDSKNWPSSSVAMARRSSSWQRTGGCSASSESPIRSRSRRREAVKRLHAEGLRVIMLTGDNRTTAEAVARSLGIDEIRAEVLPEQKGDAIKRLQAEGRIVAMAGDGINDAPALAQAQVGIAMGTGTGVAMQSAGITLVKGDLGGIARARTLSQATMRNIRQNLAFAFLYNLLGVPIAAGVLYPFFGLLLTPMLASAAMTFSSVSVILNALRLRSLELR